MHTVNLCWIDNVLWGALSCLPKSQGDLRKRGIICSHIPLIFSHDEIDYLGKGLDSVHGCRFDPIEGRLTPSVITPVGKVGTTRKASSIYNTQQQFNQEHYST